VGEVRLVDLRQEPLSVDEVLVAVRDPAAGGVVVFVGAVRDEDGGRSVATLDYTAHPTAVGVLARVADEVAALPGVVAVAAVHRDGHLDVGDVAVVVAVSAGHRGDAFVAARRLIDELKARTPIWKRQLFVDGSQEWVGSP
jgi:molybdopterin synthase catalytic subunit